MSSSLRLSLLLRAALVVTTVTLAFGDGLTVSEAADQPPVVMPPYRVDDFSTYLGFTWNARVTNRRIAELRFSRVEPNSLASKAGLMENDRVISIDGRSVNGLTVEELQQLFARKWKPGDTLVWEFTVNSGGLFGRDHPITLRMRTKPAEDTAEKSEPKSNST